MIEVKIAVLLPDNRDEFHDWENPMPWFGTAPTALLEGFAQIPEYEVHVVCCLHRPLPAPENLAPNIFYHSLVVPKWGWRFAYAGCVWKLRRKLRELRPDLVHGQGTERYCALGAVFSGLPNLITLHGNMRAVRKAVKAKLFSFYGLSALLETIALRFSDGLVCLTNYTKQQAGNLPRKTWIVPNAVDSSFFAIRREAVPKPLLLCVADAAVYKNQTRLIMSLDDLAAAHSFTLLLVGKGFSETPYGAEVLRLCRGRTWCEYAGMFDQAGLKGLLGRATALVLPSLEDNCPMAILEAMAAGVPVAASEIGGIPDLIENGVSGMLFAPLDPASMREGVETVLLKPEKAKAMSELALERARERFHPIAVARRHLEIYRELIQSLS